MVALLLDKEVSVIASNFPPNHIVYKNPLAMTIALPFSFNGSPYILCCTVKLWSIVVVGNAMVNEDQS